MTNFCEDDEPLEKIVNAWNNATSGGVTSRGSFDHQVIYHNEENTWWAECEDLPGWSAAADTRDSLTDLVAASLQELQPDCRWYWTQLPTAIWT
jgi:hypothetical protein